MDVVGKPMSRSIKDRWESFISARRKVRADAPYQNRRRFHRFPCTLPVELHLESPGHLSILKAVARNISTGGMLVECPTIPSMMSACHVTFRVPPWGPFKAEHNRMVMAEARVQHCNPAGMNFGVAFSKPI